MMKPIEFLRRTRELQEVSLQNKDAILRTPLSVDHSTVVWFNSICTFPTVQGTGPDQSHNPWESHVTASWKLFTLPGVPGALPQLLTPLSPPDTRSYRSPLEKQCLDALYKQCHCLYFFPCQCLFRGLSVSVEVRNLI